MCTVVVLMLNGSLVVVEKNSNPFFSPPLPPGVVCASLELKKRLLRRLSSMESDFNSPDNVARCSTTPSPTLTQVAVRLPKRQTESHSALPRMWTKAMFVRNPKTLSKSIFY